MCDPKWYRFRGICIQRAEYKLLERKPGGVVIGGGIRDVIAILGAVIIAAMGSGNVVSWEVEFKAEVVRMGSVLTISQWFAHCNPGCRRICYREDESSLGFWDLTPSIRAFGRVEPQSCLCVEGIANKYDEQGGEQLLHLNHHVLGAFYYSQPAQQLIYRYYY
jgi:hypothetical protein